MRVMGIGWGRWWTRVEGEQHRRVPPVRWIEVEATKWGTGGNFQKSYGTQERRGWIRVKP
jgi:hypothetical protein